MLLTLYTAAFVVGGGLVLLSAFLGDGDAEGGTDAGHDGHDGHDGGSLDGPWLPFLSIRFWIFTLCFFGMMGLATHFLAAVPVLIELAASTAVGVTAGLGVSWGVRRLQLSGSDSSVRPNDLIGREIQILLPISRERPGKIRVLVGVRQIDMTASTDEAVPIVPGDLATVIELDGTTARVVRTNALLPADEGGVT